MWLFLKCSNAQFGKFVNMPGKCGKTCLIAAVRYCCHHISIVKRLLRIKEIDVNKVNEYGQNALHCACKEGYLEIAIVKFFNFI